LTIHSENLTIRIKNNVKSIIYAFFVVTGELKMRNPKIINHKGHDIVYLDFSNMKRKSNIVETEKQAGAYIQKHAFNSLLVLSNMENMNFDHQVRDTFLDVVKDNAPFIKAAAVIGVKGLMNFVFDDFVRQSGRNFKAFKTKEEALDYLVSFI
jgi:hypothetical protein